MKSKQITFSKGIETVLGIGSIFQTKALKMQSMTAVLSANL